MDINEYIKPPHEDDLPVVIETDHALLINGMIIPFVVEDGVVCKNHKGMQEITITLLASSFVRMFGNIGKEFEKEHGLESRCSYAFTDKPKENEIVELNGEET